MAKVRKKSGGRKRRSPSIAAPSLAKQERDWEAESAADSLIRAEEVRANPKLLRRAQKVVDKKKEMVEKAIKRK